MSYAPSGIFISAHIAATAARRGPQARVHVVGLGLDLPGARDQPHPGESRSFYRAAGRARKRVSGVLMAAIVASESG